MYLYVGCIGWVLFFLSFRYLWTCIGLSLHDLRNGGLFTSDLSEGYYTASYRKYFSHASSYKRMKKIIQVISICSSNLSILLNNQIAFREFMSSLVVRLLSKLLKYLASAVTVYSSPSPFCTSPRVLQKCRYLLYVSSRWILNKLSVPNVCRVR